MTATDRATFQTDIADAATGVVAGVTDGVTPATVRGFFNALADTVLGDVNNQAGATYTLVSADVGKAVRCANASPVTVTIPPEDSAFTAPLGARVLVVQAGAGGVTLAPGAGVTLNAVDGLELHRQWSAALLVRSENGSTDEWDVLTFGAAAYDLPCSFAGTPAAGELLGLLVATRDVHLPADFAGSKGYVASTPDAVFDVDVQVDGVSVGTVSISTAGAFTFSTTSAAPVAVDAGSRIEFVAPAASPAEASIATIAFTLKGLI